MRLHEVLWQHRFDYHAVFECEFCGSHQLHENCYDDDNFQIKVIPAIECNNCGRKTDSNLEPQRKNDGISVRKEKVERYVWVKV